MEIKDTARVYFVGVGGIVGVMPLVVFGNIGRGHQYHRLAKQLKLADGAGSRARHSTCLLRWRRRHRYGRACALLSFARPPCGRIRPHSLAAYSRACEGGCGADGAGSRARHHEVGGTVCLRHIRYKGRSLDIGRTAGFHRALATLVVGLACLPHKYERRSPTSPPWLCATATKRLWIKSTEL